VSTAGAATATVPAPAPDFPFHATEIHTLNSRTLAILGASAVLAVGAAVMVVQRSGDAAAPAGAKGPMFEGLAGRSADVALVHIMRSDGEFSIRREGETWQVDEKAGYPARFDRIRETVLGMADLRPLEPKTSNPDRYAQIGVQDPEESSPAGPSSTLITLKDAQGNTLAACIVGHARPGTPPGVYIRRPGEAQSWLAAGSLEIPGDFTRWIDPEIMSIDRARIRSVSITPAIGEPYSIERSTRAQTSFTILGIPDGSTVKNTTAADAFGNALSYLTLEDITSARIIDVPTGGLIPGPHLEFRTFDGLIIMMQLADKDGRTWTRIAAAVDPAAGEVSPEIAEEAARINSKCSRWAFALPAYKTSVMKVTMDDLIQDGRPMELPPSLRGDDVTIHSPDPATLSIPLPPGLELPPGLP
jgi:hypothetical protein